MAIRKLVLTAALTVLALPGFVIALQEQWHQVTVLMRNGDRVSGGLQDVENGIVFVRVSLHDQRRLPLSDVLLIDFVGGASGLPDTELSVASRPEHLAVLRTGGSWTGQFIDVRGGEATARPGEPHVLIFRTGGEERRVGLDNVGRIYFGNYPHRTTTVTPTTPITPSSDTIRVAANAGWVPTGAFVRRGDLVTFNASGEIQLSDDQGDVAHPAGSLRGRRSTRGPLRNDLAGALIGRVGNSSAFAIGDQTTPLRMPAAGQVFLAVNDDHLEDNRGEFTVQIRGVSFTRR